MKINYVDITKNTVMDVVSGKQFEKAFVTMFTGRIPEGEGGDQLTYKILDFAKLAADMTSVSLAHTLIDLFEGKEAGNQFNREYAADFLSRIADGKA